MARNANPYDFANDAGRFMDIATADKLAGPRRTVGGVQCSVFSGKPYGGELDGGC